MNNKELMNLAADNIRLLAVSMVEKRNQDIPVEPWVAPTS